MARTESISIQVHPNDEQNQIQLMQEFGWILLSTQEIKTIDNHLERRGDTIYQVTNSERYVKLAFSRDLDTPGLSKIRELEKSFFSLREPVLFKPKKFPPHWLLWLIAIFVPYLDFFVIPGWLVYYFALYRKLKKQYEEGYQREYLNMTNNKEVILKEVRNCFSAAV